MKHVSYPVNPCSRGRGGVCEGEIEIGKERGNGEEEREVEEEEGREKKETELRKRETCRLGGRGGMKERVQRKQKDNGERAIGSHAADIPLSLSSVPGETTYMDPETSSDFMVSLESNEHNTVLPWH